MATTAHDIFRPFPFKLPSNDWAQKTFLQNTIALKGAHNKSTKQIGDWFIKAGLIDPDYDVNLAMQLATFQWLIHNIGIYETKSISGGCEIGNPEVNKATALSLVEAFSMCVSRCGNSIMDRERTFMLLTLRNETNPRQVLDAIRKASNTEYDIYTTVIHQNPDARVDGAKRFNWIDVRSTNTDQELVDLIVKWFRHDKSVHSAVNDLVKWYDSIKSFTPAKAPKTLDVALTAFDLAAPSKPLDAPPTAKKKRSHSKKVKILPTEVIDASKLDVGKEEVVGFDQAYDAITRHYMSLVENAGIPLSVIPITAGPIVWTNALRRVNPVDFQAAGPIVWTNGEFRYDTTFETRKGPPSTIPLNKLSVEQADIFQRHLEAFDVAFTQYIETNTHAKAQTKLAKGIMSFLQSKKKK